MLPERRGTSGTGRRASSSRSACLRPEPLTVFDLSDTHAGIDEYDADTQRLVSHHFTLLDGRWERLSVPFRAVGPRSST